MFKYIFKKIAILVASLWTVVSLTFVLVHAIPGDPFTNEEAISKEILEAIRHYYGLDKPLWEQYKDYIARLLHGDLGPSLVYQGRTSNSIIAGGFPVSLKLGLESLFLAIALGLPIGALGALKKSKWQDSFIMLAAVVGISVPSFILATLLQYVFAMQLGWLPVARWGSFLHSILPALSLAALPTAVIARLTRSNMLEVLQQDYILTARTKGLSLIQVIFRHSLRNALLPIITYLGTLTANILTGSFVIEKIFGIPGLGQWFVLSVLNRDYALVLSLTIFYSTFLMICVFLVDIVCAWIDPRIKGHDNE